MALIRADNTLELDGLDQIRRSKTSFFNTRTVEARKKCQHLRVLYQLFDEAAPSPLITARLFGCGPSPTPEVPQIPFSSAIWKEAGPVIDGRGNAHSSMSNAAQHLFPSGTKVVDVCPFEELLT